MMEEVLKTIAEEMAKQTKLIERAAVAQEMTLELYMNRVADKKVTEAVPVVEHPRDSSQATEPVANTVVSEGSHIAPAPAAPAADEVSDAERNELKAKLAGLGFTSLPRLRGTSLRKMLAQAEANIAAGKAANAGMAGNIPFNPPTVAAPAAGVESPAPVAATTAIPEPSVPSASPATGDDFDAPVAVPSVEEVRNALRDYSAKMAKKLGSDDAGIAKAREQMAKFGVQRVSDLPEAKRAELIKALV